jgi:cytoskeletal protein CcmA (bactofilin family)
MGIGQWGRVNERDSGSKMQTAEAGEARLDAFIDGGSRFDGKVRLNGTLRIDGEFSGEVVSADTVVIGEPAGVEATLRAKNVIIRGAVVGNVVASRQVILRGSGRLQGSVETPSLIIEPGATFNGSSKMFRPEEVVRNEEAAATTPVTKPAPAAAATRTRRFPDAPRTPVVGA